jgi:hypothetical protein
MLSCLRALNTPEASTAISLEQQIPPAARFSKVSLWKAPHVSTTWSASRRFTAINQSLVNAATAWLDKHLGIRVEVATASAQSILSAVSQTLH